MTSSTKANEQTNSKRKAVVISVIAIVAAVALALGVGFGVRARQARAAAASRAKAVASARADCNKSVDRLQSAIRSFRSTADGKSVKSALKLTGKQVADPKTVGELRQASTVSVKPVACSASTVSGLERASKVNAGRARSLSAQSVRLTTAASAVLKSKNAKDAEVRAARAKADAQKKADEQRKAQAAKAQAASKSAPKSAPARRSGFERIPSDCPSFNVASPVYCAASLVHATQVVYCATPVLHAASLVHSA